MSVCTDTSRKVKFKYILFLFIDDLTDVYYSKSIQASKSFVKTQPRKQIELNCSLKGAYL